MTNMGIGPFSTNASAHGSTTTGRAKIDPPVFTRGAGIPIYPCDYGMRSGPRGLHQFEANEYGTVCRNCGAKPKED